MPDKFMSWETFGHNQIKNILQKQLENGQLAHAYLFLGPNGLGKKLLALELAKKALKTEKLQNHPDFVFFEGREGEVSVDDVRRLIGELATKPFMGGRKVVVLDNAQKLNASSSNALLKILEEPSVSTIIILIASQKPLPTIVSRCQVFRFNPFSKKLLEEYAKYFHLIAKESFYDLSFGSPARLEKFCRQKDFAEAEEQMLGRFSEVSALPKGERLTRISEFAAMETTELEGILSAWMMHAVFKLKSNPLLAQAVSGLQNALRELKTNKNKKLILQGLFSKI